MEKIIGIDPFEIPAYENHNQNIESWQGEIFLGLKYQCVEYARRWLVNVKGLTFGPVEYAYQIWDLKFLINTKTAEKIPLIKRLPLEEPKIGDLLIYKKEFRQTGHIAVVTAIKENSLFLSEQNFNNEPWKGTYSRKLPIPESEKLTLGYLTY